MALILKPGTSWWETYARCVQVAPEAFDSDRLRNLTRGEWRRIGIPRHLATRYISALAEEPDGTVWAGSVGEGLFQF